MPRYRRTIAALTVAVTAGTLATAPQASAATCATGWGSLPKSAGATSVAPLAGVRAGSHECYDRLVLDVRPGTADGYRVQYVDQVVVDGSGEPVPLRGGARLAVVAQAPAYDDAGNATYQPAVPSELAAVAGYRTFRQVAWAGSFEGQSTVGLGVRARLPFRVSVLRDAGASRLVVDVAHTW